MAPHHRQEGRKGVERKKVKEEKTALPPAAGGKFLSTRALKTEGKGVDIRSEIKKNDFIFFRKNPG